MPRNCGSGAFATAALLARRRTGPSTRQAALSWRRRRRLQLLLPRRRRALPQEAPTLHKELRAAILLEKWGEAKGDSERRSADVLQRWSMSSKRSGMSDVTQLTRSAFVAVVVASSARRGLASWVT